MEKAYRNLGFLLLLLIPLTFLGFYKTYFNQFPAFADTRTYIHIHAVIAATWILILIAQPILIRYGKYQLHRQIGKITYLVFPLLILSFIPGMINVANSETPSILFFPLSDVIMMIILYPLAVYHRKNTAKHMRYMIGIALVFLDPTLGRVGVLLLELSDKLNQNLLCAVIYLILIGLIYFDRKHSRNYSPYLLIYSMWVIHQITFNLMF